MTSSDATAIPGRNRRLALVAVPIGLAFAFALIRPQWLASAPAQPAKETTTPANGGGISFSFGGGMGPAVDVQQPGRGRIVEVVNAPATIRPGSEVSVDAPFDGRIRELCVDEGWAVVQSQVIFRLDPVEWDDKVREAELELARRRAALAESEAGLREAEHRYAESRKEPSALTEARLKIPQAELARDRSAAQLQNAEAKLARALDMLDQKVGKQEDVDAAKAEKRIEEINLKTATGEVEIAVKTLGFRERAWLDEKATAEKSLATAQTTAARARSDVHVGEVALERARRDRERCDVRTPIAGVVTRRSVNEGELVTRGGPTTTHYIVSDLHRMLAYADVDEGDVVKIALEQPARVRVAALGDELRLPGIVYDIANRAAQKQGEETRSFRVRILLTSTDQRLRPDMTASVEIETRSSAADSQRIPLQAVLEKPKRELPPEHGGSGGDRARPKEGEKTSDRKPREDHVPCVFTLVGDEVKLTPVKLGARDGEFVEVLSGVSPDDWLVLGPYRALEALKHNDKVRATRKDRPRDGAIAASGSATPAAAAMPR